MGNVGILQAGQSEEHDVWIMATNSSLTGLYGFMRQETPNDAETLVTATYMDSAGRKFKRDFVLTTEVDGQIRWTLRGVMGVSSTEAI